MSHRFDGNTTASPQFATFKNCLTRCILTEPGVIEQSGGQDEADDLDDFMSYLAEEAWSALPSAIHEATYETREAVPDVDSNAELPLAAIPAPFVDTLISCGFVAADEPAEEAAALLRRVLRDYVAEACAPPPVWSRTRTSECEICEREVPLMFHHHYT